MEIEGRMNSIFWSKQMQNMNVTFPRVYKYLLCLSHSNAIHQDGIISLNVDLLYTHELDMLPCSLNHLTSSKLDSFLTVVGFYISLCIISLCMPLISWYIDAYVRFFQ